MTYFTMAQVKRANKDAGYHWFDRETLRFFNSRYGRTVYGGRYFISSERFDWKSPRLYTVREIQEDGNIEQASEFQEFSYWVQARRAITKLINGTVDTPEIEAAYNQSELWDEYGNNPTGTWDYRESHTAGDDPYREA